MRTTLDLDDALIARAKAEAARRRTTLTRLIERGLARELDAASEGEAPQEPFRWRVFGDPNTKFDLAEYERRVREADDEWAMRQAGLLPFRDPAGAAE